MQRATSYRKGVGMHIQDSSRPSVIPTGPDGRYQYTEDLMRLSEANQGRGAGDPRLYLLYIWQRGSRSWPSTQTPTSRVISSEGSNMASILG